MYKLKCNQPTYFDLDDTLLYWGYSDVPFQSSITVELEGFCNHVKPHKAHVEQLKAHKARGHTIIVWSKGGVDWAEAGVKALALERYVDLVIEKPQWLYDDAKYEDFLPKRYFLEDK